MRLAMRMYYISIGPLITALLTIYIEQHNSLVRTLLESYRGYEVTFANHSFEISFSNVSSAVKFCNALQTSLLKVSWPNGISKHPGYASFFFWRLEIAILCLVLGRSHTLWAKPAIGTLLRCMHIDLLESRSPLTFEDLYIFLKKY